MAFYAMIGYYEWSNSVDLKDPLVRDKENKIMRALRELQIQNIKTLYNLLILNGVDSELDGNLILPEENPYFTDFFPRLTLMFEGKKCSLPRINNSNTVCVYITISSDKSRKKDEYIITFRITYGGYHVYTQDVQFCPEEEIFVDINGEPFDNIKKSETEEGSRPNHDIYYVISVLMSKLDKYRIPPEIVYKNAAAAEEEA